MSSIVPILPLLPLIERRANDIVRAQRRAGRVVLYALGAGTVVLVIVAGVKKHRANQAIAKLATDINARNAALYVEAVKPPGLLMKLLSFAPVIGTVMQVGDIIANWAGINDNEKILQITDMVEDWNATVGYYSDFTGGRSLNKDIKKKMGDQYPKFVDRLGKNTKAVDAERRRRGNEANTQKDSDKLRDQIMKSTPGKVVTSPVQNAKGVKLMPKSAEGAQLYSEPDHRKDGQAAGGKYTGATTGRFLNHANKMAMVEMITANGRKWAEWNSMTIFSNG